MAHHPRFFVLNDSAKISSAGNVLLYAYTLLVRTCTGKRRPISISMIVTCYGNFRHPSPQPVAKLDGQCIQDLLVCIANGTNIYEWSPSWIARHRTHGEAVVILCANLDLRYCVSEPPSWFSDCRLLTYTPDCY